MPLADAGWLAFEIAKATKAKDKDAQNETVKSLANALAGKQKENDATRALFRKLIRGQAGDLAKGHEATPEQLRAHLADPAVLARLKKLGGAPKKIAERLAKQIEEMPKTLKRVSTTVVAELGDMKKAIKGDAGAGLEAGLAVALVLGKMQALFTDAKRVPDLWRAVGAEATAMTSAAAVLGEAVPELIEANLAEMAQGVASGEVPFDKIIEPVLLAIAGEYGGE